VIIIAVNIQEISACANKLEGVLQNRKDIVVFCFQRGVKSAGSMKEK
jgi:hypothetical protein